MSDRPGLAAARRRYKVLKRCDENDEVIKKEIAQLESDFPELSPAVVPPLSSATRATLEGGALVAAIENEDSNNQHAAATASATAAASSSSQQLQPQDEVRQKLKELAEFTKQLERDAVLKEETLQREREKQQRNNDAAVSFVHKAVAAAHAYEAFHTFPQHCSPNVMEALGAILCGVACPLLHYTLFPRTLCDAKAAQLNPVVWAVALVVIRAVSSLVQQRNSAGSVIVTGIVVFGSATVRSVLVAVVAFTFYAITSVLLQFAGLIFPPRFCAEF